MVPETVFYESQFKDETMNFWYTGYCSLNWGDPKLQEKTSSSSYFIGWNIVTVLLIYPNTLGCMSFGSITIKIVIQITE